MNKIIMTSWLTSRAKRIEKKCLSKFGRSLSFPSIEMILKDDAIISYNSGEGTCIIDIDKFKKNEKKYLKECGF